MFLLTVSSNEDFLIMAGCCISEPVVILNKMSISIEILDTIQIKEFV